MDKSVSDALVSICGSRVVWVCLYQAGGIRGPVDNKNNIDHQSLVLQVRAQLDEQRNITALVPRQPLEVHETVAECMIYANHWVAHEIQKTFPHQALLRRHPPPRQEFLNQLVESAKAMGFTIDTR